MNVAKKYIKHPITGEMIYPCEMYQTEIEENTQKNEIQKSNEEEK